MNVASPDNKENEVTSTTSATSATMATSLPSNVAETLACGLSPWLCRPSGADDSDQNAHAIPHNNCHVSTKKPPGTRSSKTSLSTIPEEASNASEQDTLLSSVSFVKPKRPCDFEREECSFQAFFFILAGKSRPPPTL